MTINQVGGRGGGGSFFNFGRFYSFILWFVPHLPLTQHWLLREQGMGVRLPVTSVSLGQLCRILGAGVSHDPLCSPETHGDPLHSPGIRGDLLILHRSIGV